MQMICTPSWPAWSMYLSVRSIWALRMVSMDSLTSAARAVWIKPHFTIRGIFRFSDLGSVVIISLILGGGGGGGGATGGATGAGAATGTRLGEKRLKSQRRSLMRGAYYRSA